MAIKGFKCKECNKPFYLIIDEPEYIADDIRSIKKYKNLGYKFQRLTNKEGICTCSHKCG